MPRVVIIDKLIRSNRGHFLEFALRVGDAFKADGYEAVYLANSRFKGAKPKGLLRAIEFDFDRIVLGLDTKRRTAAARERRELERKARFLERLRLSSLGVASAAIADMRRRELPEGQRSALVAALLLSGSLLGLRLIGVVGLVALWPIRAIWRGGRSGASAIAASTAGEWFSVRFRYVLQRIALREQVSIARRLAQGVLTDPGGADAQARSITASLKRLDLKPEDVVLCTTVTEADLGVFQEVLRATPQLHAPVWNFIFREPIFTAQGPSYVVGQAHRGLRTKLLTIKAIGGLRTRWWTDTKELAEQYCELGAFDFRPLPILMPTSLHDISRQPLSIGSTVRLGYFGDARPEKGYSELPAIVTALARRKKAWITNLARATHSEVAADLAESQLGPVIRTPREMMLRRLRRRLAHARVKLASTPMSDSTAGLPPVTVLAQSNFNVPDGVSSTRAAKYRLSAMDDVGVEIFSSAASSADYVANFGKVDAVVLYYDHPLYIAGSSGVFAEALLAGRPVITTDRSWGGRQLRSSEPYLEQLWGEIGRAAVLRLRPQFEAQAGSAWHVLRPGITHIAARVEFRGRLVTDQLRLVCEFALRDGNVVSRERTHCSRLGRSASALRIPEGAYAVRSRVERLNPRLASADWDLELLGLTRSDARDPPLYAIGIVVSHADELPDAVTELARHLRHYRGTARDFARHWADEHDHTRFVARLLGHTERPLPELTCTPQPQPAVMGADSALASGR